MNGDLPPLPDEPVDGSNQISPCSLFALTPSNDLRFHDLHGNNAVITNGGRTAFRQNCRSEFNDAIVISSRALREGEMFEILIQKMVDRWSGSIEAGVTAIRPEDLEFPSTMTDIDYDTWMLSGTAIMQDGNTTRNNYGCDLDSLTTGSRIGMMRNLNGDLHYYINGVDQGVACSGLPPELYAVVDLYGQCVQVSITSGSPPVDNSLSLSNATEKSFPIHSPVPGIAHRFHSNCGKNVALQNDGCRAVRIHGFSHGVVLGLKELRSDEVFEVKIDEIDEQWSGSLHMGLTTLQPLDASCTSSGLPSTLLELRSKVSWLVSGSEVRRNGTLQKQNYGFSMERLTVGNRVGVKRASDDTMHILVDGEDMGVAAAGIAKNVFAVVDLYGKVVSVSIVSSSTLEEPECTKLPSMSSDNCSEEEEELSPLSRCSVAVVIVLFPLRLAELYAVVDLYGQCVQVSITSGSPPVDNSLSLSNATEKSFPIHSPVPGIAHRFHSNCGKNVALQNDGCRAVRIHGFSHGVVLGLKELRSDEVFEVKIDEIDEQWSGSLHMGLTTLQPLDASCTSSGLPSTLLELRSKVSWLVSGSEVRRNGTLQKQNYGFSMERLTVGNRVGVKRASDDTMHILVDGEDMGVAAAGIAKNVFAVVDLYGKVVSVSIVSSSALEEPECTKLPSMSSDNCSEEEEELSPCENEGAVFRATVEFMENHGRNILLSSNGHTASRVASYNQGVVASAHPLPRQLLFQIQIDRLNSQWTSSLSLGVIGNSPERFNFPGTASSIKRSAWLIQRDSVFHNSLKICDNYGPNLDTCPEGTVLGLLVDNTHGLHLFVNGMDQGVAAQDIPNPCYVVIDLYGQCEQVTIVANDVMATGGDGGHLRCQGDVEKADVVDGIKENLCWTPPPEVNRMKTCEYQALCARFKELLPLPDGYFDEELKCNLCYCESCHKLRGDEAYYKRGDPPKDYALPFGWCRFALRLNPRCEVANVYKKWHTAYHGTCVGSLRRALDHGELVSGSASIFCSKQTKAELQNGYNDPEENSQEKDIVKVSLSPTMRYVGLDRFCPKIRLVPGRHVYTLRAILHLHTLQLTGPGILFTFKNQKLYPEKEKADGSVSNTENKDQ
ncbi:neuralized-like protein 4 [Scyliorhinus canicula]|uniref:neuralized-like protein 4 n=1 Tax=Scyliorhinus canicula TaxID=7830 RepID=UPI0018F6F546|nr:neuralized-like protein 4 [Scyliorhinus canicula]